MPRSEATLAQRIMSIATPAELGLSSTERRSSRFIGTPPNSAPFHAQEADLVVVLPGDVVGRADMDVVVVEPLLGDRLHRLGLRDLLRGQPRAVRHVEEVGIAAGVELVGAVELDAALGEQVGQHAVDDGRAELRLDVVADDRHAGVAEALGPGRDRWR